MEKFENIQVSTSDNYTTPEMARLFHSFPRFSVLSFQPVSNNFDLNLEDGKLELNPYFMSLLFYPAACAILLLLSIVITGIVSCCMCCRAPPESKSGNLTCLKVFIVAFSILIGCSTGIGGYGNFQCSLGTQELVQSSDNISTHVSSIYDEVKETKGGLEATDFSLQLLSSTFNYIFEAVGDQEAEENAKTVEDARRIVTQVEEKLSQAQSWRIFNHNTDMEVIKAFIVEMEFMRSICTWSLLGWCGLISFTIFLAVLCTSEVFLMVGAVMGIFGLIAAFSLTAWYLVFALGVSDFCMDPHGVFYNQSDFTQTDMAYFLDCPPPHYQVPTGPDDKVNPNNPYSSDLQRAFDKYYESNKTLVQLKRDAAVDGREPVMLMFELIQQNMHKVKASLDATASKTECIVVHQNLVSGLNAVCYTFLEGVDFVFGAGLITALCLFILVILSACTWGQMDRQAEYCAGSYDQLDDPYRRTTGLRPHDNGRYGMYAGGGNYHRLGPAGANAAAGVAGPSREGGHPPPPSYVQSVRTSDVSEL
ncbi:protein tweety homolog 1-A-like [Symsagittifera roscoffensis]|uniref:protein tweety homolog 1-A-like n=1 Tax=Symsagittifera roscoffensis TaxID=84072 RepID=UPI00307C8902